MHTLPHCYIFTTLYILHYIHIYTYIYMYRFLQGLLRQPGPGHRRGLAAGGIRRGKGQNYDLT